MSYFKQTAKIRSEVTNNYVFVRNLKDKGGVIDAHLPEKTIILVSNALQQIKNESFIEVWNILMAIKGVRFRYTSN